MQVYAKARQCWHLWSVRLAAAAGVIAAVLSANPALLTWLVNEFLPAGPARILASASIGLLVFIVPTIVRLLPQRRKDRLTNG